MSSNHSFFLTHSLYLSLSLYISIVPYTSISCCWYKAPPLFHCSIVAAVYTGKVATVFSQTLVFPYCAPLFYTQYTLLHIFYSFTFDNYSAQPCLNYWYKSFAMAEKPPCKYTGLTMLYSRPCTVFWWIRKKHIYDPAWSPAMFFLG